MIQPFQMRSEYHVDRQKLVKDALDLVNINSPTGSEADVGEAYASKLRELGFRVSMQEVEAGRFNVLGVLKGQKIDAASLMFNGHLDTSFAANEDPQILNAISPVYRTQPPWGYVKDNTLFGMGAFNMKSALAAYLAAARTIQDSGETLDGDLLIAGVVGEIEKTQVDTFRGPQYRGYGHGTSYLVTHGGTADCAVLGEPTGLRLMCAHSGSCWFKIAVRGSLVHTAHSQNTGNAISQMRKVIAAVEDWVPQYQEKFSYGGSKPTVNIGSIEGGWPWRASRTPLFCNLYIDVRFPPRYHALDVKEDLLQALQSIKESEGITTYLDLYLIDEWSEVSEDEYISKSVSRAHSDVFQKPVEVVYFSWSSDANILTRHGIPAVNYGPSGGPGRETRGTMYIPNLEKCANVYTLITKDICSRKRTEIRSTRKSEQREANRVFQKSHYRARKNP